MSALDEADLLETAGRLMNTEGLDSETRKRRLFFLGWGSQLIAAAAFIRTQWASGILSEAEIVGVMQFNIEVAREFLATDLEGSTK